MASFTARGAHKVARFEITRPDDAKLHGKAGIVFTLRSDGKILRQFRMLGAFDRVEISTPTIAYTIKANKDLRAVFAKLRERYVTAGNTVSEIENC